MSFVKGFAFVVGVSCSIILLTYLATIIFPKNEKTNLNYYRAAVLEVIPFSDKSLPIIDVVKKNLETYQLAADLAGSDKVDIIVFPEGILYSDFNDHKHDRSALINSIASDIPNPREGDYNPCEQKAEFENHYLLSNLSCMAKTNSIYIVANLVDYKICKDGSGTKDRNATLNCSDKDKCPTDGMYFYNTNVVFNRAGKLIVRYYKKHLYHEPTMDQSHCSFDGFFDTDFGNFTTFICYDMSFKDGIDNIEKLNVDNLAFPFHWFEATPLFLFATVYQGSYAFSHRINFLAANAHVPGDGSLGSGIFSGQNGHLISSHEPDGYSKLLITNVPKKPKTFPINSNDLNRKRFKLLNGSFVEVKVEDDIILEDQCEVKVVGPPKDITKDYRCKTFDLDGYEFEKLNKIEDKIRICKNSFCCDLYYKAHSLEEDYFLVISVEDSQFIPLESYSTQICFLARCKSENGNDCSSFYVKSNTTFEKVEINGTFSTQYTYPFAVDANIRLTSKDKWIYDGQSKISYQNSKDESSLLFFGINGKDYTND